MAETSQSDEKRLWVPGSYLICLESFFLCHFRQMPGHCLKLDHYHTFLYPFKFITPPRHSTLYYLSYSQRHRLIDTYGHVSLNDAAKWSFNYLLAGRDLDGGCLYVCVLKWHFTEGSDRNHAKKPQSGNPTEVRNGCLIDTQDSRVINILNFFTFWKYYLYIYFYVQRPYFYCNEMCDIQHWNAFSGRDRRCLLSRGWMSFLSSDQSVELYFTPPTRAW